MPPPRRGMPEQRQEHDEQVVPMHGKGNMIDFSKVDDSTYDMLGGGIKNTGNESQPTPQPDEPISEDQLKVINLPQSQSCLLYASRAHET